VPSSRCKNSGIPPASVSRLSCVKDLARFCTV
jgi:hypothetical protein